MVCLHRSLKCRLTSEWHQIWLSRSIGHDGIIELKLPGHKWIVPDFLCNSNYSDKRLLRLSILLWSKTANFSFKAIWFFVDLNFSCKNKYVYVCGLTNIACAWLLLYFVFENEDSSLIISWFKLRKTENKDNNFCFLSWILEKKNLHLQT